MKQVSRRSSTKFFSVGAVLGATLLLCLTAMLAVAPAAFSAPERASYVVVLKDDVAHPANVAHRHEENRGARISHIYGVAIKGYSADLTPGALKAIKKDPNVDYVESDGVIRPKGQLVGNQLKRVYANMSQLGIDGNDVPADRVNVDIAILDTGVYAHPDLNVVSRVNCVEGGGGCKPGQVNDDKSGHGTHVAGDAAAIDNGIGMVGTAPGARIWSVKVVNDMGHIGTDEVGMSLNGLVTPGADLKDGNAKMSDAIAGINWVTINSSQIEVANMSFACATDEWGCARTALAEAIATSVNNGVVWVAAAGHEGMGVTDNSYGIRHYPALLSDVITVSAMADYDGLPGSLSNSNGCPLEKGFQHDDRLMWEGKEPVGLVSGGLGSNYGPEVDMTAPGSCVFSTWSPYASGSNAYGIPGSNPLGTPTGSEYGFMYGSSVASGLVAGAAADIAARSNPNNRADVENIRAALLGAGNYNWEDLVDKGVGLVSPDGSKEPLLSLDGLTSVPSPPSPVVTPPTVTMGAVSNVTESSATISGTVNPNGHDGRYKFVCGRSGYSLSMVSKSEGTYFPTGTSPINVSWTVSGLYPGASYYCHLAAWNIGNIENPVYSPAANFTTPLAAGYVAAGAPAPLRVSDGSIHVFTRLKGVGDELNFTRATSGMWTAANLTPAGQPKMGNSSAVLQMKNGAMHAFAINTAGDIVAYYRTGSEPWNYINLSAYAGATLKFDKTTTPSAVEWGPNRVGVYARAVNGDLVSLERTAEGSWFMWNESEKSVGSHPTIVGSPAAVVTDGSSAYANTGLIVFARNASNQLISFNCNAKGEWIPYNVSANTGMSIKASPSAIVVDPLVNAGSVLSVYAPNTSDELVEFNRAASGMWTTYNVTKNIPGGPTITGSAAPIRLDPSVHADSVLGVYARTTDNDLVGFDRKTNGAWYFYNVSAYNSYPKISSSPAVLSLNPANYFGSVLQVHARSTSDDLLSFDRKTNGGWLFYNETFNVPGNLKVE